MSVGYESWFSLWIKLIQLHRHFCFFKTWIHFILINFSENITLIFVCVKLIGNGAFTFHIQTLKCCYNNSFLVFFFSIGLKKSYICLHETHRRLYWLLIKPNLLLTDFSCPSTLSDLAHFHFTFRVQL